MSAPLLLVSFVSSSGWTSRIFSPAQLERAMPQLEKLDFPLLVSEYHPDNAPAATATATAICYSPEYQATMLMRLKKDFGVDTAPAAALAGQALTDWIYAAEDEVFKKEFAEFQAQTAAFKAQFIKT